MVLNNVILTGGSGTLGKELQRLKPDLICPSSRDLDITNRENVERYFIENKKQNFYRYHNSLWQKK